MLKLKKIGYYIICFGILGIFIVMEFNINDSLSIIPLGIISVGSILLIFSDFKIHQYITKKNIAFFIFTCSFHAIYILTFVLSNYMDTFMNDILNMYLLIGISIPMILSFIYLLIHSKRTRELFTSIF